MPTKLLKSAENVLPETPRTDGGEQLRQGLLPLLARGIAADSRCEGRRQQRRLCCIGLRAALEVPDIGRKRCEGMRAAGKRRL